MNFPVLISFRIIVSSMCVLYTSSFSLSFVTRRCLVQVLDQRSKQLWNVAAFTSASYLTNDCSHISSPTQRKQTSARLYAFPKYRTLQNSNSRFQSTISNRTVKKDTNPVGRSSLSTATAVPDTIETPTHVLRVKGFPTKTTGTAIGWYCFERSAPDDEPIEGSVFFQLSRTAFEAYYSGIISSLDYLEKEMGIKSVTVQCDHETVIHQLNGKYEIQRKSLRTLYWKVMEMKEERFDNIRFEYIPSEENKEAAGLASKALGSKTLTKNRLAMNDPMQPAKVTRIQKPTETVIVESETSVRLEQPKPESESLKTTPVEEETCDNAWNYLLEEHTEEEPDALVRGRNQTDEAKRVMPREHDEIWSILEEEMDDLDMVEEDADEAKEGSEGKVTSAPLGRRPGIDPSHTYIIEFDGGARGNPAGVAGAGMVLYDTGSSGAEKQEIWAGWMYLGKGIMTNNQAEYSALIAGLEAALDRGITKILVMGDSDLILKHISGKFVVRNAGLKPLFEKAKALLKRFESYELKHIRRNLNQRADGLANLAMDNLESGSSD